MKDLIAIVIEQLEDSRFKPGEHEAYAFVMDTYLGKMPKSRIRDVFMQELDKLDWDMIEKSLGSS